MVREYKDSGITWIGSIPKEWKTERIKALFSERNERDCQGKTLLSVSQYFGIRPKSETDLADSHIAESYDDYKEVRKGDFVMNIMLAWNGSYAVSDYDGIVSPAYCVFKFRKDCCKKYFHYLLRTDGYPSAFKTMSRGVIDSRLRLYPEQFYTFPVIIPSVDEQQRIADYLDKKCAEIDGLIELQEQMIAQLTDYKQSVITEAVTKGLNPNVEFVHSGVDWIGDVPKGWRIAQTRRIVRNHLQGYYDADGYVTSGYRLLRITDLLSNGNLSLENAPFVKETPNIKDFILQPGDFCFARTGGAGNFGFVSGDIEPAVFASYLIRFRFSGQNNNYLRYYFLSYSFISEVNSLIHGGVNKNIHAENIKDTHLPLPPLSEQKSIADYLDKECKEIDDLIAIKQQKIETLKEYKKSVIFEAVTGKIEIS